MKKKTIKLFACAAVMTMALSLGACGDKKEESDTKAKTEESADVEEDTTEDDSSSSTAMYDSIEEYVNDDLFQEQFEAMKSTLDGSGMNLDIRGEGDKLIYTYTYTDIVKEEGMAETLQAGLDSQKATFQQVASSLKLAVDVENPIVVVEYIDANGEVIYAGEFTEAE